MRSMAARINLCCSDNVLDRAAFSSRSSSSLEVSSAICKFKFLTLEVNSFRTGSFRLQLPTTPFPVSTRLAPQIVATGSARRQLCLGVCNFSHKAQRFSLVRIEFRPQGDGLGFQILIRSFLTKCEKPSRFLKEMMMRCQLAACAVMPSTPPCCVRCSLTSLSLSLSLSILSLSVRTCFLLRMSMRSRVSSSATSAAFRYLQTSSNSSSFSPLFADRVSGENTILAKLNPKRGGHWTGPKKWGRAPISGSGPVLFRFGSRTQPNIKGKTGVETWGQFFALASRLVTSIQAMVV